MTKTEICIPQSRPEKTGKTIVSKKDITTKSPKKYAIRNKTLPAVRFNKVK